MSRLLVTIRILETIGLICVVSCFKTDETFFKEVPAAGERRTSSSGRLHSEGTNWSITAHAQFDVSLPSNSADSPRKRHVFISSLIVGYLLSLTGTLLDKKTPRKILWTSSCVLSSLGVASYANEILRYLSSGYDVQFIASAGIVLVIIDWSMLVRQRTKPATEPSEDEAAGLSTG